MLWSVDEGVDQLLLDSVMMPTDKSPVSLVSVCFLVLYESLFYLLFIQHITIRWTSIATHNSGYVFIIVLI